MPLKGLWLLSSRQQIAKEGFYAYLLAIHYVIKCQFMHVILVLNNILSRIRITFEFKRAFSHSKFPEAVFRDKLKGCQSGSREIRKTGCKYPDTKS